ncbi:MAG TPA: hypothetical protein VIG33_03165 [Pseudobdellovibrionaceae bacterium]|jgi:hypothetical protein
MRWDETWHRLLEWTNRQTSSERLSAIILTHEGYKDLDPSHPLGGKDGGKDALCTRDGKKWVMAVYFPRGKQSLKDIKGKFLEDLPGVQKNGADGIVFVTNQELTLGERDDIKALAEEAHCEIYHLERITTLLDTPNMHAVRKQFLDIDFAASTTTSPDDDWKLLEENSKNLMSRVPDMIGNKVRLARKNDVENIEAKIKETPIVVVLGDSGVGKSGLCKSIVAARDEKYHSLWLKAKSLNEQDFNAIGIKIGISGALQNLLKQGKKPGLLVLDGLEKLSTDAEFTNLGILLGILLPLETEWQVILTCQPEAYDRIQQGLASVNVFTANWGKVELTAPKKEELEEVWKAFPNLQTIKLQRELSTLLDNLKILDLLASKSATPGALDPAKSWVGESDIIDWFWERFVLTQAEGPKRSRFMQILAEKIADAMDDEIAEVEFEGSDLDPVDSLLADGLCVRSSSNLGFAHDLYGDWARQRLIVSKKNGVKAFIEQKIIFPQWHRAIRLYGQQLLEKNQTVDAWKSAVKSFEVADGKPSLTQDLFLDAIVFCAQPYAMLERSWPVLVEDGGKYLRRLLSRFRHVATSPNPAMLKYAKEVGIVSPAKAASFQRIPFGPQWIPVLVFLHSHKEEVITLSLGLTADISYMWLSMAPHGAPGRNEAAELAVMCAEEILAVEATVDFTIFEDEVDETSLKAAMTAVKEQPQRVENLVKFACRRSEPVGALKAVVDKSAEEAQKVVQKSPLHAPV